MATSGSVNFSVSRDDIITEALQYCQVLADGESPSANQLTSCSRTLNLMVKGWINHGITLWAVQEGTIFLEKDKGTYNMSSSGDNITDSWTSTTLGTAASASDGTIDVDSISGMASGDYIGIVTDDNTMHWTTINGAPSGTTVTLTDAMDSAAASASKVYFYTTKANPAQNFIDAVHRDGVSSSDRPLNIIARMDYYNNYGNKTSNGQVTEIYVDKQLDQTNVLVYPEPDRSTDRIEFTYQRTLEDFDVAADTPDFPQEWYEALCWNLAKRLMIKYGTPSEVRGEIRTNAMESLGEALAFDTEQSSVYITADTQGNS